VFGEYGYRGPFERAGDAAKLRVYPKTRCF
jgi:hypothetical protein